MHCFRSIRDVEAYVDGALGSEGTPELCRILAGRLRMRALDLGVAWEQDWTPVVSMPDATWFALVDGAAREAAQRRARLRGKPAGSAQHKILAALEALGGGPVSILELCSSPLLGRVRSVRRPVEKLHAKNLVVFDPIADTVRLRD